MKFSLFEAKIPCNLSPNQEKKENDDYASSNMSNKAFREQNHALSLV